MVATVLTALDLQHYAVSAMQYSYQLLPSVTVSYAADAQMLGAFGLVPYRFTYPYQVRACDGAVDQVGLDLASAGLPSLTILYRAPIWLYPAHGEALPGPPPPLDDTTHSTETMCYVML